MIDAVVVVVDGCYSLLMLFAASVADYCCLTISVNSVSAVVVEIETAVDYYFAPPPPLLLYYK